MRFLFRDRHPASAEDAEKLLAATGVELAPWQRHFLGQVYGGTTMIGSEEFQRRIAPIRAVGVTMEEAGRNYEANRPALVAAAFGPAGSGDLEQLKAAWAKATTDPRALRRNDRENLRRNLPRKTRFRLMLHHLSNKALIWFCRTRRGSAAARKLWRL